MVTDKSNKIIFARIGIHLIWSKTFIIINRFLFINSSILSSQNLRKRIHKSTHEHPHINIKGTKPFKKTFVFKTQTYKFSYPQLCFPEIIWGHRFYLLLNVSSETLMVPMEKIWHHCNSQKLPPGGVLLKRCS